MKLTPEQVEELQAALLAMASTMNMVLDEVYSMTGGTSPCDSLFDDSMKRLDSALKLLDPTWETVSSGDFEVYREWLYLRRIAGVGVDITKHVRPGMTVVDGNGDVVVKADGTLVRKPS